MTDLWRCTACWRKLTREQIEKAPCPCGGLKFLAIADLERGDRAIKKLVKKSKRARGAVH